MMDENLDEYIFTKFAATYFQGNASAEYTKKPLKQSLLPLKSEGDQLAALAVWITVLRFMGDLPDMKVHAVAESRASRDNTSVMSKIYSTLGRKFNKRDLEEAQRMSEEIENMPSQQTKVKGRFERSARFKRISARQMLFLAMIKRKLSRTNKIRVK
jgi:myosin-7